MNQAPELSREEKLSRLDDDRQVGQRHLKCSFAPDFFNNPYQRLLKDGLSTHDVDVEIRDTIHEIAADCISGRAKSDVVHLHWLPTVKRSPGSVLGALKLIINLRKLQSRGVGVVWTAHNLIPHESALPACDSMLTSMVARMVDRIIVHTEAAGREVERSCGAVVRPKVRMIPHGNYLGVYPEPQLATNARDQLGLGSDDFVFMFIGAIRPHKGVSEMIDAFRKAKLDARLVVAGNVSDKEFEKRLKDEEKRTPGLMILPGYVANEMVPVLHEAADMVVFPHQRALTSGALVLAMSFGKPCLVPSLDTLTEMVGDDGGVRYPPGDLAGMADAMKTAYDERSALQAMGDSNLVKARQWDWPGVARKTREVYEEAMLLRNP